MYFVYLKKIFQEAPKADCAVLPKANRRRKGPAPPDGIMIAKTYDEIAACLRFRRFFHRIGALF